MPPSSSVTVPPGLARGIPFFRRRQVLPGQGLTLGFTLFYLSILVLLPFAALAARTFSVSPGELWAAISGPRAVASYRLTASSAFLAAAFNAGFGLIIAWTLVRLKPVFWRWLDALIDVPFALPAAVGGIALTAVLGPNSVIGAALGKLGIQPAYSPLGIVVAMTFVGLPFAVRAIQPVLEQLDRTLEDAAFSFGATPWETARHVILPPLIPAILTGFSMAFARGVGEYGAVIFISGNIPMKSEVTSTIIAHKLDQYDYAGAAGVAVVMLAASFLALLAINLLQAWSARYRVRR